MPDIAGPFDGPANTTGSWGQDQWYRDAYARDRSGVYGTGAATVNDGEFALAVNGLAWSVGLGRAHVRGSGYERTGGPVTGSFPTNTNSNPRVDRLVIRRDLAAKTVTVVALQGTPAASPVAPALSQVENGVWDVPLYRVTVPGSSGTVLSNPIDDRPWLGISGLQPTRDRQVISSAAGTLPAATDLVNTTISGAPFGPGVQFKVTVDAKVTLELPGGAGAQVEIFIGGVSAGMDKVGNGGSSQATFTLKANESAYRTSQDAPVAVRAVLSPVSGTPTNVGAGRLYITAVPYISL